mmetsp:Transcript_9433/g.16355  ORF Transcript_9433/g.16355 Transcript_9433/m.16355 type:complete len:204 (-) Transcript_9433:1522-2133(-)
MINFHSSLALRRPWMVIYVVITGSVLFCWWFGWVEDFLACISGDCELVNAVCTVRFGRIELFCASRFCKYCILKLLDCFSETRALLSLVRFFFKEKLLFRVGTKHLNGVNIHLTTGTAAALTVVAAAVVAIHGAFKLVRFGRQVRFVRVTFEYIAPGAFEHSPFCVYQVRCNFRLFCAGIVSRLATVVKSRFRRSSLHDRFCL